MGFSQEVDLLLNDGSKNLSALDWRKSGLLPSRVELSRRQSRRCLLMALALASTPEQKVCFTCSESSVFLSEGMCVILTDILRVRRERFVFRASCRLSSVMHKDVFAE